jgi:hypothetical protein
LGLAFGFPGWLKGEDLENGARLDSLSSLELERAFEASSLPEEPARGSDLDRLLIRLRTRLGP